ncbi:MAG: SRPBCC family protein [Gemmatimonadales bacterium]
MKIVLIVLAVLVVLVVAVLLAGFALPRNHRATSRITLTRPPAEVWAVVRDLGALLGTWKELRSARRLPDQAGREVWEHNAGGFPMRLVIEEAEAPRRLVTRIDAPPDAAFGGQWIYGLEPAGSGTQVTVTEDGYVSNPMFRTMMYLMGTHRTVDGYLRALGRKFGETVKPEHVRTSPG